MLRSLSRFSGGWLRFPVRPAASVVLPPASSLQPQPASLSRTKVTWTRQQPPNWQPNKPARHRGRRGDGHGGPKPRRGGGRQHFNKDFRGKRSSILDPRGLQLVNREMSTEDVLSIIEESSDRLLIPHDVSTAFTVLKRDVQNAGRIVAHPSFGRLIRAAHAHARSGQLNAIAGSNIIHGLSKLRGWPEGWTKSEVLDPLLEHASAYVTEYNAWSTANVIWSLGNASYMPEDHIFQQLLNSVKATAADTQPQGLANILHALAKLGYCPAKDTDGVDELIDALLIATKAQLGEFRPQGIAVIIHALGKLEYQPQDVTITEAIIQEGLQALDRFEPQGIAALLHGLGRLRYQPTNNEMWESLYQRATDNLCNSSPYEIVSTLRSWSKMDHPPSREHVNAFIGAAIEKLDEFKPEHLANTLYALHRLHRHIKMNSNEIDTLINAAIGMLDEFTARDFCGVLHVVSKLHFKPGSGAVLDAILAAVLKHSEHMDEGGVSSTLHSLARLGHRPQGEDEAVDALLRAAIELSDNAGSQHFSRVLHGLGSLNYRPSDVALMGKLMAIVMGKVDEFSPLGLSYSLSGLSRLGLEPSDDAVVDACINAAVNKIDDFEPQTISIALYALGTLDYRPTFERLVDNLVNAFASTSQDFCARDIASACGGLSKLKLSESTHQRVKALMLNDILCRIEHEFEPPHIATLLFALNHSDTTDWPGTVINTLVHTVSKRKEEFNADELATITHALSELNDEALSCEVFEGLMHCSLAQSESFKPHQVAKFLGALGRIGYSPNSDGKKALDALVGVAVNHANGFSSQDVATIICALGTLAHRPSDGNAIDVLLVAAAANEKLNANFSPEQIEEIRSALDKLGYQPSDEHVIDAFLGEAAAETEAQLQQQET